jgi:antitoxin component of MazEF toxin-antitoxin module
MLEMESKLRKWGRSFGVVIPMEKIREAQLHEDETLKILIRKKKNPLKQTFGIMKFKKTTQEILHESDRECWDE